MGQEEIKKMIEAYSFETAIKRLGEVVELLESGEIPLDDAINLYYEGVLLSRHCDQKLINVEQKIQVLMEEEGKLLSKDFDTQEE